MASLYDIRERAQRAEAGRYPNTVESTELKTTIEGTDPMQKSAQGEPVTGKDYSAIYAAICAYHDKHNPPRLTLEYWESAANDLCEISARLGNDPFVIALLEAVYGELEREHNYLKTK